METAESLQNCTNLIIVCMVFLQLKNKYNCSKFSMLYIDDYNFDEYKVDFYLVIQI